MIEIDNCKLYHGDCLEVMTDLINKGVKVDAIITDPPYELENHGGTKSDMAKRAAKVRDEIEFIAKGFDYDKCFSLMLSLCPIPNFIIFCSNNQISNIMSFFEKKGLSVQLLIWNKTNPSPLCNGKYIQYIEFIVYVRGKNAPFNNDSPIAYKYRVKKYPFVYPTLKTHPTQKPIELMNELVEVHSFKNNTILDCFMGSGTTGVACVKTKRKFIGIEKEEKYFNIAKQRIEDELKQGELF